MTDRQPTRVAAQQTPLSQPYFDGCNVGELRIQICPGCQHGQFYPRLLCARCGCEELAWQSASGKGKIATYTVVRRALSKAYEAPYVIALVDLDEGVRMMSQVINVNPDTVASGQRVTVCFQQWSEDQAMPVFTLDEQS